MKVIAFDTETKGLRWFDPDGQAFLVTWADEDGEYCTHVGDEAGVRAFRQALASADAVVGHNLKFDAHQVRETLGFDPLDGKQPHDTDLMSRVLFPEGQRKGERGGHGLKDLAKVWLRSDADDPEEAIKEMAKAIGLRTIKQDGAYYEVWRAYPDVMEEYAIADARYTYDLYDKFSQQALGDRVYELEMQVFPILLEAERRGIRTDQDAVRRLKGEYTAQQDEVFERLSHELGEQALGGEGSEDALVEALLKVGIPLHEKTELTGKLATNKFALQEFEAEYPVISDLFEYRRLERFLTTYIGAVEGREFVHPTFYQCGAWTGRMSCSSPNFQNLPKRAGKEVREVLRPREGHAFVVLDYEGIEIRLLAYYLGDEGFRELVGSGSHDPHAWMAANIWGGSIEDYVKGSAKENTHRLPAKNILFAITYGAGKKRVRNMLRDAGMPSSEDNAKAVSSKIKASLPNYYKLNKRIRNKIETVGYVNTIMGRKNPVKKDKSYVGLNALIQGSAADIMKQGLINVSEAVADLGGVPLLVVHDEVVVEVPVENANEALGRMETALTAAYDLDPPLAVEGSVVTTSYADA